MLLKSEPKQGVLVLTFTEPHLQSDELTDALYQEMASATAGVEKPRVALDFRDVKTISAAGLRSMLKLRRHIRERDGQLLLCGLSFEVADVFYTTRLASSTSSSIIPFAVAPDVTAAVAHLSKNLP